MCPSGMTYLLSDGSESMCPSGMTYLLSDGSESRCVRVEWRIYSVMVLNQDNVSEWNDISTQWWFWIKIMCGMTYLLSDGSESR